jgi:two-component system chemotaxis sensor kinase CheA
MKGNASYFGMESLTKLTHELETLLDLCRTEKIRVTAEVVNVLLAGVDELRSMLGRMRMGQGEVGDQALFERLIHEIESTGSAGANIDEWGSLMASLDWLKADGDVSEERLAMIGKVIQSVTMLVGGAQKVAADVVKASVDDAVAPQTESTSEAARDGGAGGDDPSAWDHPGRRASDKALKRSMRVPEEAINEFLELVGELVVIGEMYDHVRQRLVSIDPESDSADELSRVNETFLETSLALQKGIMNVRLVPMRATLQKVPRLVRDIAQKTGKSIEVELIGEDAQVDKSHVGILEAPITHMVRNAARRLQDTTCSRERGRRFNTHNEPDVSFDLVLASARRTPQAAASPKLRAYAVDPDLPPGARNSTSGTESSTSPRVMTLRASATLPSPMFKNSARVLARINRPCRGR